MDDGALVGHEPDVGRAAAPDIGDLTGKTLARSLVTLVPSQCATMPARPTSHISLAALPAPLLKTDFL